jgi:hypothetical protein
VIQVIGIDRIDTPQRYVPDSDASSSALRFRHYSNLHLPILLFSTMASQPLMPGLTSYHNPSAGVSATPSSGGDSSPTDPRLPVNGFRHEPQSYEPLTHLLNKIIDAVNQYVPQSQLTGLRFHPFGDEVKETYGSHKGLKPDLVGIIGELPTGTEEAAEEPAEKPSLSWEQIEVNLESKVSIRDMVRQSGTYARCRVLRNKRRFFSLGMGFHYKKVEAYVFSFPSRRAFIIPSAEAYDT